RLVAQVTRPVRWDACMARLRELGVTAVIELPPAGTLVGLVKRDLQGTATLALKTPDDLDKAVDLITEPAAADTRRPPRSSGPPRRLPAPGSSAWAARSRRTSSPTTTSRSGWTPTTSGSASGWASGAAGSPRRARCWSTWPPRRAPAP